MMSFVRVIFAPEKKSGCSNHHSAVIVNAFVIIDVIVIIIVVVIAIVNVKFAFSSNIQPFDLAFIAVHLT